MNTPVSAFKCARRMGPALLALFFVIAGPGAAAGMGGKPEAPATESPAQETARPAGQTPAQAPAQLPAQTPVRVAPQQQAAPSTSPTTASPGAAARNLQDDAIVIRNDAPGYNGYAGTWRDPETGDIVTSVIAPRRQQEQTQPAPVYIAPQIDPQWPANGYGYQGWNGGWQQGVPGVTGNGWQRGGNTGWPPAPPPPGAQNYPGQPFPGQMAPGQVPPVQNAPGQIPSGQMPSGVTPPGAPPLAAQPGSGPSQRPEGPGPGGLPLPDMQPGMHPPQAGSAPTQPGTFPGARPPFNGQQGNWQGAPPPQPPNGQPQNWQNGNWQPPNWQPSGWQPAWQGPAGQPGAWRPWGPAGTSAGIKSWTPGQPPHGNWQPLSWSPAQAWNPWQRPPAPMRMGHGFGPGMGGRFAAMPALPPNITRHLGPVVPLGQRGGPR